MFATIPFTIEIKNKLYNGYLQVRDFAEPPTIFWVFIGNIIVGELTCSDKWIFDQGKRYETLGQLPEDEVTRIAEYLGNVAVEAYE